MLFDVRLVERLDKRRPLCRAAAHDVLHFQRRQIAPALVVQHARDVQRAIGEGVVVFHLAIVRAAPQQKGDAAEHHRKDERDKVELKIALGVHAHDAHQIHQRGKAADDDHNPHQHIHQREHALMPPARNLLQKVVHFDTSEELIRLYYSIEFEKVEPKTQKSNKHFFPARGFYAIMAIGRRLNAVPTTKRRKPRFEMSLLRQLVCRKPAILPQLQAAAFARPPDARAGSAEGKPSLSHALHAPAALADRRCLHGLRAFDDRGDLPGRLLGLQLPHHAPVYARRIHPDGQHRHHERPPPGPLHRLLRLGR